MQTAGERWRLGHRPGLDGLRGIAILFVIAAHTCKDLGYRSGGVAGVTVFFVLSGFLITSLLLEEHDRTGTVSLTGFYERRARRLLPALGVLLVFVATVYVASGASLNRLAWVVLYVGNWPRAAGHELGLVNHTWSLAIEEQFYIVWPLLLIVGLRWRRSVLLTVTATAAVASFGLRLLLWGGTADQDRIWFGTDTNAFALLAGCALALWMVSRRADRTRPAAAVAAAVTLAVVAANGSTFSYTLVVPLAAAVGGVVMIVALCGDGPVGVFGSGWLRYAGRRSYAWYLWHVPLLVLLRLELGVDPITAAIVGVGLTVAIAEASWRLVERPVLQRRRQPIGRIVPVAASQMPEAAQSTAAIVAVPSSQMPDAAGSTANRVAVATSQR